MSDEKDTDRIGRALTKALDSHGYSFQHTVLRKCVELFQHRHSHWTFEVSKLPVEAKGGPTRIDFVLRFTNSYAARNAYLVCECKRANPAIRNWAFVRAPYTRHGRHQRFVVFEAVSVEQSTGRLFSAPLRLIEKTEPYDIAIELKGDPKGESVGSGRGTIEDAATQVLRGVGGLADFFGTSPQVLHGPALIVPVIFSTAKLYTSSVDLGAADIHTGLLPHIRCVPETPPWLWFQYNVSATLRHSVARELPKDGLTSLGSVLEYNHARSIAVVNPDGIESFLQEMPTNLEDVEPLKP